MSINITSRLAKFDELIPSNIPFVEGKLKGHQDRKNYSVIGPGVSEDAKQNVKIIPHFFSARRAEEETIPIIAAGQPRLIARVILATFKGGP